MVRIEGVLGKVRRNGLFSIHGTDNELDHLGTDDLDRLYHYRQSTVPSGATSLPAILCAVYISIQFN